MRDLPEDFIEVPVGSGWYGYSNLPASIERYGLTLDEYHAMLDRQHGACAICGRESPSVGPLVIDHDHTAGRVRGLLCQHCNLGLGHFFEFPDYLECAARYTETHGSWVTRGEDPPSGWRWNAPVPGDP
jgi:hypothetical protein